jgi:hypothetical protein
VALPGPRPKKEGRFQRGSGQASIETASQNNSVSDCYRAVACASSDSLQRKSSLLAEKILRRGQRPSSPAPVSIGGHQENNHLQPGKETRARHDLHG